MDAEEEGADGACSAALAFGPAADDDFLHADVCRQVVEQAQRAGHLDPAADVAVLGGVIVTTHRGLEALAKAGVDTETRNRIADATIDNLALT
ncbi:MAG TPA: hypothetical protein VI357_01275 [Mycobacteriales bacterium]